MTTRTSLLLLACLAAALLPQGAAALTVTLAECDEGADFIRNAAYV